MLRVDGRIVNGGVIFTVDVDAADATGGVLLYRVDGDVDWRRLNLAPAGDRRLSGAAPLPAGTVAVDSAIAQVLDGAGNVGIGRFKGRGYIAEGLPAPDPGGPRFVSNPVAAAPALVHRLALDHARPRRPRSRPRASSSASTAGPRRRTAVAFTIPAPVEGVHVLTARAADGAQVERVVAIDSQGPVVTGTILTQPRADGSYRLPSPSAGPARTRRPASRPARPTRCSPRTASASPSAPRAPIWPATRGPGR